MTYANLRIYADLVIDHAIERADSGGKLPQEREAEIAQVLDDAYLRLSPNERDLVEKIFPVRKES